ncbi:MAG: selenium-dependent xanthine dehydrogenase [Calditrichaeota bacterium]|nr:MAG: selenium-dependent xanthine dehydrogenase [Calditrichota bacterium]
MHFILNGQKKEYTGASDLSLLKYLREFEKITSLKDGCAPQASCGCCTVELNGKAVLACAIKMEKVADGEVYTIEGLEQKTKDALGDAFVAAGGVQCGFCTPGFVMRAKAIIDKNPEPDLQEIRKALTPNLCRCTGYKKIEDAILIAAESLRDNKPVAELVSSGGIGEREPKYEAKKLALGQRPFVADMFFESMLHGALKFSDHPRAKVVTMNFDKAKALPGVVQIFTADDIPGDRLTGLIVQDWPVMIAVGEETRYIGDVLACVVATNDAIAREAVAAIEVEYEIFEPISDTHFALTKQAPRIHPKGNLLSQTTINRGDVENGLKNAAFVSAGVYNTQRIEHAFMEPECCIAMPENGQLQVYSQGQGIYEDRKSIARILGQNEEDVLVTLVPNGGGFGGKEDLTVQGHAAIAAQILQKPVKIELNREESIRMHPKRHPVEMHYTLTCDSSGKLTALKADIIGDTGAYASVGMKVLERAAGHATGAYHIPAVEIDSKAVYTNNLPCGAMRGFGVNQVAFALESCIDDLCEQGGFDRWQFRYDNALKDGDMTSTGQVITGGCGAHETLLAVKDTFKNAKYAGIACGLKNTGIGNGMPDESKVKIEIISADHVVLHHGWTEMGQGVHTMAIQFLSQVAGIDPKIVEVKVETASGAEAGMTTASRATSLIGNATIDAAEKLKNDLENCTLADLVGKTYHGEWVCDWTTKPGADVDEIITHYSYSYATQVVILDDAGQIEKVIAAHDAGKIINPNLFEGQIQGAVHMGLGYALSEDLELENSVPKNMRLRKCGVLRAKETPEIEVIGVEVADPHGPFGAKGVGEIGLVPTAAAVANAFYQFDGVRRVSLPLRRK